MIFHLIEKENNHRDKSILQVFLRTKWKRARGQGSALQINEKRKQKIRKTPSTKNKENKHKRKTKHGNGTPNNLRIEEERKSLYDRRKKQIVTPASGTSFRVR
jgi:hypothetical protein